MEILLGSWEEYWAHVRQSLSSSSNILSILSFLSILDVEEKNRLTIEPAKLHKPQARVICNRPNTSPTVSTGAVRRLT